MDYNSRDEVDNNYKWDIASRYVNIEAWQKDFDKLKQEINNISKYKGIILKSAKNFLNCLNDYFVMVGYLTKLYVYASAKYYEEVSNTQYSAMYNNAYQLYNSFDEISSFITPEILKGSQKVLTKYLDDKTLAKYHFYLTKIIRYKDHTLSSDEEKIITQLLASSNVFEKTNETLINSILDYGKLLVDDEEKTLTNGNYRLIMTNKNRETRKTCFNLMSSRIKEYNVIFADNLIGNMISVYKLSQVKKYTSVLDMELFGSNIPKDVVKNLYKVVNSRIDAYQKYIDYLKKNIGISPIYNYDLDTEFINNSMTFTIEDAQLLITNALSILGADYLQIVDKAFKEKWIDYCVYKGKAAYGFCTSNYGNHPLILVNYHGKFTNISTIAHELGHAVNFYLSQENNHMHEANNDIFVAEVASLTNEILLSDYIIKNSKDKTLKLIAINNLIDIIQNNLFDACLEGELENVLYDKLEHNEEISADLINETICEIRKKYYKDNVKLDDNTKYMWARRSHYFAPYYLFQYATGVSAAIYIATKIINNDKTMLKNYLEFLKKGQSDYPTNLLENIGVDMTKPKVINNAIDYFEYLIDEFSKASEE